MPNLTAHEGALVWRNGHQTLRVEAWGGDSLRVRATLWARLAEDRVGALLALEPCDPTITIENGLGRIANGRISCEINQDSGDLTFFRDDLPILREQSSYTIDVVMPARRLSHGDGELLDVEVDFDSDADEVFYGLGQNPNGALNQKGNHIAFRQQNGTVSVPFAVSSKGYGLFWNNPSIGGVSLNNNRSLWRAKGCVQLDYWITVGSGQKEIVQNYTRATGLAPKFPDWASGFWQSRLRYETRDELESVAKTHLDKGYPLSVIVIDYFNWTKHGEWKFNAPDWPDPTDMVTKLEDQGVKTMISIWPSVNPLAENFAELDSNGYLIRSREGSHLKTPFLERGVEGQVNITYYDATNPEARKYVWERCKDGYYKHGIKLWWLDACEPELYPDSHENTLYWAGAGSAVTNAYPYFNAMAFYDGMKSEGEEDVLLLSRSAWAGSQRFGALVWTGDVKSTFRALSEQIKMGLNMAASGMSWWTTDIGGFQGGHAEDPEFRELLIRWFQFGVFCPVCRLHGNRLPSDYINGGPNELWSYGPEVEDILAEQLQHREALRPYVHDQMAAYQTHGTPVMRSLAMEFPEDDAALAIDDTYMFGDAYLVAPVIEYGARSRQVYLPKGSDWVCYWTGATFEGGQWITADAPLHTMPVFKRN
ncbi:glycoside hydrolase family 31 protein [Candidatus Rhodobacter oscarellae]|uniref:glycoside hydrolase family 31 protein n=1 Tax=Candidatus Rhodobacter oscarellae TaxID=1675527 RepID=UPI000ACC071C|nr:glycoside hydrolase family 31 protein [Candidatus Rhodobacter lobularis]